MPLLRCAACSRLINREWLNRFAAQSGKKIGKTKNFFARPETTNKSFYFNNEHTINASNYVSRTHSPATTLF